MNDYKLSPEALVMVSGSSRGTQKKYYEDGYWYKKNRNGYEGLSEYLTSVVLSCSNVNDYVTYEKCTINGESGCRSKSFLKPGETFMSFQRLYNIYNGANLSEMIIPMNSVSERVKFVKDFILDILDYDISDYLSKITTLDMLTINIDRHLNNLGLIVNQEKGKCIGAPIFDNGAALLSDYGMFNPDDNIVSCIEKATAQPFSSSFEMQAKECGITLKIDYDTLEEKLKEEPSSRALDVLLYQLERYKNILAV